MTEKEIETAAKDFADNVTKDPLRWAHSITAFKYGAKWALQQNRCYIEQQLTYVLSRPLSQITDGQKMAYNDVLLTIDRPDLNNHYKPNENENKAITTTNNS